MKRHMKKNRAFTLIEVLVVATIIGVLVTVAAVSFSSSQKRSRDARRKTDLETVRQALVLYRQDHGSYGDVSSGFASVIDSLSTAGYLTSSSIAEPKTGHTQYSLSCINGVPTACNQVSLTAYLENDPNPNYEIRTP